MYCWHLTRKEALCPSLRHQSCPHVGHGLGTRGSLLPSPGSLHCPVPAAEPACDLDAQRMASARHISASGGRQKSLSS